MRIYLATNTKNDKQYVGMTAGDPQRRFRGHCRSAAGGSKLPFHLAIAKYGESAFTLEVLHNATSRAELQALERQEIAARGTIAPGGYNLTPGGDGQPKGYAPSEEARAKIGAAHRNIWARLSDEERRERGAKISAAKKGRPRKSAPSSLKGIARSPEFRSAVSAGMKALVAALPEGEMSRRAKCRKA